MTFHGFPVAALDFYEDLEADNSKVWWLAHKEIYDEQVRAPIDAATAELADEFGPGKPFRPYRDVRFAKDKTPYKTHQGVWFTESHRYFHISAAGLFVAGGYWQMSSAQVGRLRRAVADDASGPALEAALADPAAAQFDVGGQQLTRVPSGFDKNHPRADLLRHKALTLGRELGCPDWLPTPDALDQIRAQWRAMDPIVAWLNTHVGDD